MTDSPLLMDDEEPCCCFSTLKQQQGHGATNNAQFLAVEELGELLHITPAAMYKMRYRGEGPPGFRVGKRLLFDPEDINDWLEKRKEISNNENQ